MSNCRLKGVTYRGIPAHRRQSPPKPPKQRPAESEAKTA